MKGEKIYEDEAVITHRQLCNTTCHVLCEEKIFFCAAAAAAVYGGMFPLKRNDYIDLKKIVKRKDLLNFANGHISAEYDGFCTVCGGYGLDNPKVITAAKQHEGEVRKNRFLVTVQPAEQLRFL